MAPPSKPSAAGPSPSAADSKAVEAPVKKAPEHEPGSPGDPNPNKKVPTPPTPAAKAEK